MGFLKTPDAHLPPNWHCQSTVETAIFKPRLHDTTGCQPGWTTSLTQPVWMFVYTTQAVLQRVWQPVRQPVVSCKRGLRAYTVDKQAYFSVHWRLRNIVSFSYLLLIYQITQSNRSQPLNMPEVCYTSYLRPLRIGEEKRKKERKKKEEETTWRKYNGLPYSIGRP